MPLFRRFTREGRRVGLRTQEPVSTRFGLDRGRLVRLFYIGRFPEQNKLLICGQMREVHDYAVGQSDALHGARVALEPRQEELPTEELDCRQDDYELIVTVKARRAE